MGASLLALAKSIYYVIHSKYLGDILYLVLYVYAFSLLLIYVSLQKLMRVEQLTLRTG